MGQLLTYNLTKGKNMTTENNNTTLPNVDIFEKTVADKNYEIACIQLLDILEHLD